LNDKELRLVILAMVLEHTRLEEEYGIRAVMFAADALERYVKGGGIPEAAPKKGEDKP
jgi:hypothetical protein